MPDLSPADLLDDLLTRAKRAGADSADALYVNGVSQSVSQRLGKPQAVERSEGRDLGLRVFVGRQQAVVSTTDFKGDALADMVERAIAMARVAPEDPYAGLADPSQIATTWPTLEMFDTTRPSAETLVERARIAEDAARSVPGITNSEGAEAGFSASDVTVAATNGFTGSYQRSSYSLSVSVIAGTGQKMEQDYDYSGKVFDADLDDPAAVGTRAGERAVRRLNPRKPKTGRLPVVLDPRVARSMLAYLAQATNGSAIARGTSFLKNDMGAQLFRPEVRIMDDPHRPRGFRSKPFDAEGLATKPRAVIDAGHLTSWTLDLATARQLGLESTASAARGVTGGPSPSVGNFYMAAGSVSPEALIKDIESGFYITEMMGTSVNLITGDYSRGAAGFWIENGEITFPVSELTVGGHLRDIFASLTAADDLEFKYGMDSPTLRIEGLLLAGGEA